MRRMRKAGLFGALTLASAVAVVGISSAAVSTGTDTQNGVSQSVFGEVIGGKLPKKGDGKGVTLNTGVRIESPGQKPPPATKAVIEYGPDIHVNTKGVPVCTASSIATANTETAKQTCKNAIVGEGTAQATCSANTNPPDIPNVTVTAFNGNAQGTRSGNRAYNPKGSILLHTYANLGGTDQINVVPGKLSKGSGKYSTFATFIVPPLAGGVCSFLNFDVDIDAEFKVKGEKVPYITATCKNKKIPLGGEFTYAANSQNVSSLHPETEMTCKQAKG